MKKGNLEGRPNGLNLIALPIVIVGAFMFGLLEPGTKLYSLGNVYFDTYYEVYAYASATWCFAAFLVTDYLDWTKWQIFNACTVTFLCSFSIYLLL